MKVQPATYVTRVSAVNPGFQYHTEWALEASNNINHCIGVIPMAAEGSGRLGAALILHKTHNVELRINDDSYFENLLMQYEDSPFPLTENKKDPAKDVIDVCIDDDGNPEDAMAQFFDPRHTTPSKRWAVIWSRGGAPALGFTTTTPEREVPNLLLGGFPHTLQKNKMRFLIFFLCQYYASQ